MNTVEANKMPVKCIFNSLLSNILSWERWNSRIRGFVSARGEQTAAVVAHEIFIRDTCFIIRIDRLSSSSSSPPRRRGIDLPLGHRGKSHEDELRAGNELVLMSSEFPSSVLSQLHGYSSASEPRGPSDSLSVTADGRWDNNVRVPTNCDWCCRDEGSSFLYDL